jgi:hypothetical protein
MVVLPLIAPINFDLSPNPSPKERGASETSNFTIIF